MPNINNKLLVGVTIGSLLSTASFAIGFKYVYNIIYNKKKSKHFNIKMFRDFIKAELTHGAGKYESVSIKDLDDFDKATKNNKLAELLEAEEKYNQQIYTGQEFCKRVFKLAAEHGYYNLIKSFYFKEEFAQIIENKEFINQCFLLAFDNHHIKLFGQLSIMSGDKNIIDVTMRDEDDNDVVLRCLLKGNYSFLLKIAMIKDLQTTYKMALDHVNNDGMNVYLAAAKIGSVDILKYLDNIYTSEQDIDKKTSIYKRDNRGLDAYLFASANGHVEVMKYLETTHNWNIHTKSEIITDNKYKNKTELIRHDKGMIIPFFGNQSENDTVNNDHFRFDAFVLAIINGRKNVFEYLLKEHHWKLHISDKNGNDSYLMAAFHGQCGMMNHLDTQYKWNINKVNNNGENAFLMAARGGHIRCMNYIFWRNTLNKPDQQLIPPTVPLNNNIGHGHCLYNGTCQFNVYNQNNNGFDAFLLAAGNNQVAAMKYLIDKYKWNIHTIDLGSYDAYLIATICNSYDVMDYLEKDLDWNIYSITVGGDNAYMLAARYLNFEMIKYLEKKHQEKLLQDPTITHSFDIKNYKGKNAYMIASSVNCNKENKEKQREIIEYLGMKELEKTFKPSGQIREIEITEDNQDKCQCIICKEKIENNDLICHCENDHNVHKDCYFEYILTNRETTFNCIYCKSLMNKTIDSVKFNP